MIMINWRSKVNKNGKEIIRTNLISSRVVIEESNCIQCLLESRLTINNGTIKSKKLRIINKILLKAKNLPILMHLFFYLS